MIYDDLLMIYAGAACLHHSGDESKSAANLRPKLSSHERWLTRGWLLLMNKVSVLRLGDHLFSSSALSLAVLSNIYEAQFHTRSSDGAGRSGTVKGQGPVLCLGFQLFILLIFLLKQSSLFPIWKWLGLCVIWEAISPRRNTESLTAQQKTTK